jgi:hypothetical protein
MRLIYCLERGGRVTYKYVGFGLDTEFFVHLTLAPLMITVPSGALTNSQLQSI